LLAHLDIVLQEPSLQKLEKWLARREQHEPLSYIRGFTEFYGRQFKVDKRVLEPRPESETMIELLKQLGRRAQGLGGSRMKIADIGTGSGALAITAHLEVPTAEVVATDIDAGCLAVAAKNAKAHKAPISFFQGDLFYPLSPMPYPLFAVLANLPYVPSHYRVNEAAGREPRLAIFGGGDGLELYRRLFSQLAGHYSPPKFVLTESLPMQHERLADIANTAGYRQNRHQDFIQVFSSE
jgi:release factor glutamine methyltransferase